MDKFNPKELKYCPYEILELEKPETSEITDIKLKFLKKKIATSYRKLSLKYHPDRNPNDLVK